MWLLGESQHCQKSKLEEKGMSHIITNMDELTLSPTHSTASTAYKRPMHGTQSSNSLTEVRLLHTTHTEPKHTQTPLCQLSVISWCVCFNLQSEVVDGRSGLTQGDKLRALKSRRSPRPATTGALRYQTHHHHLQCRQNTNLSTDRAPPTATCSTFTSRRFVCTN